MKKTFDKDACLVKGACLVEDACLVKDASKKRKSGFEVAIARFAARP